MRKIFVILGLLLVLIVVGAFIAAFFLGSAVTKAVNRFAPAITGTPVTLDGAVISPFSGTGTLTGLFVGNPPGWKSDKAFSFARVHVDIKPSSLFDDYIVINEVAIEGPEFVYETKIISSNIKELLANIEKSLGDPDKPGGQPTTKEGKPIKFEVKQFRVQDAKVTVGLGSNTLTVTMPPLVMTNLGTHEGGLTAEELAGKIAAEVLKNITGAVAASVGKENALSGAARKAGENIKQLLGEPTPRN